MKHAHKIPVIIITGYLGSGKTTLMKNLLSRETRKIALVVNDMGSVNIDAALLNRGQVTAVQMVEMQNGCICCTLRDEFIAQLVRLSGDPSVEAVFVEASGISEPSAIASALLSWLEDNPSSRLYLSSVTTVVDADRIYHEFLGNLRAGAEADEGDIINLVMDQIEFCDLLVLNKTDLLDEKQNSLVIRALREIQQSADILPSVNGNVDFEKIVHGRPFDFDTVAGSSVMQRTLDAGNHTSFTDEYGISSFLYEDRRPLDREKFLQFIAEYPPSLIRTKGYLWFADDPAHAQLFEQAGRNASITEMTEWMCAIPPEELEGLLRDFPDLSEDWDPEYGDRINQLVFIGKGYSQSEIEARMQACVSA